MFKYKKDWQAGNADVIFFAGFFIVLFILWWASGAGKNGADGQSKSLFSVPKAGTPVVSGGGINNSSGKDDDADGSIKYNEEGQPLSPFSGQVQISSLGSAKSEYDPDFEYIVIRASGNKEPINITGWSLQNGRNRNPPALNITLQKGVATQVYLPEGRLVYLVPGLDFLQPIRLASGEEAIISTGHTPNVGSYYGSFKTNICLGYLEEDDEEFYPSLKNQCPDSEIEPGIEFVNDNCREFIADMSRCHTPEFKNYTEENGRRRNIPSVDNISNLSSNCRDFLRNHYSYRGCVNNHINDDGFYGSQWRIYLNRPWEMWAKGDETITLFDDRGLVVDQESY